MSVATFLICCLVVAGHYGMAVSADMEANFEADFEADLDADMEADFVAGCPDMTSRQAKFKQGCVWAASTCTDCASQCLVNSFPASEITVAPSKELLFEGISQNIMCMLMPLTMKPVIMMYKEIMSGMSGSMSGTRRRSLLSSLDGVRHSLVTASQSGNVDVQQITAKLAGFKRLVETNIAAGNTATRERYLQESMSDYTDAQLAEFKTCITADDVKFLSTMGQNSGDSSPSGDSAAESADNDGMAMLLEQMNGLVQNCTTQDVTAAQSNQLKVLLELAGTTFESSDGSETPDMFAALDLGTAGKVCMLKSWNWNEFGDFMDILEEVAPCLDVTDPKCKVDYLAVPTETCAATMLRMIGVDQTSSESIAAAMTKLQDTCSKRKNEADCLGKAPTAEFENAIAAAEAKASAPPTSTSASALFGVPAAVILFATAAACLV